jgi:hypothetical protein
MTDKAEQEERRRVILQDRNWREGQKRKPDTMFARAQTDEERSAEMGRFRHLTQHHIVGTSPIAYPKLPPSSPWASPLPCEEPLIDGTDCGEELGYAIDGANGPGSEPSPSGGTSDDQHNGEVSPPLSPEPSDLPIALARAPPVETASPGGAHPSKATFRRRI